MGKVAEVREPESYLEARKDTNWRGFMEEEMRALEKNETWDLFDISKCMKLIECKWVYKVYYKANGSLIDARPD